MDVASAVDLQPGKGDAPAARKLLQTADTTVVAFRFGPGQRLLQHTCAHAIVLTCAEGSVQFSAEERTETLVPGGVIRVDPRVPHAVDAPDGALLFVTMLVR